MNEGLEQLLATQFRELRPPTGMPDWEDVQRKANKLTVRRHCRRLGVGAAAVFVSIAVATPALGVGGQVLRLFGGSGPTPPRVVQAVGLTDLDAPPGMATGVIASETREVMEVPLSTGKTAVVWVAPTRAGGFCQFASTDGRHSAGGGGCDRDRSIQLSPGLMIPGPISPDGKVLKPPVIISGDTLLRGATRVELRFEDGESAKAPLIWIADPINAGFFLYEVPPAHWQPGHAISEIAVEDATGKELAVEPLTMPAFDNSKPARTARDRSSGR